MKQGSGGDIGIHGSIELATSLWKAGLIAELQLVIAPAVAGRGRRLFGGDDTLQRLALRSVERTAGGTLLVAYGRVADVV
jgi:dihydrofolate reductase